MHNHYRHAIEDFEKETGVPYDDAAYPTPESVSPELLKMVVWRVSPTPGIKKRARGVYGA